MSDRLEAARMHLTQAHTRSKGSVTSETTEHLAAAERCLHEAERHRLVDYAVDASNAGPMTPEGRACMRELMQLIDAELSPEIETRAFRTASDGGVR